MQIPLLTLCREWVKSLLRPVVLVNNAGITKDNLLMRMSEVEWSEVIDTNLSGAFRVTKPALRGMLKARWGRIVNVGSVVGRLGNPGSRQLCCQ